MRKIYSLCLTALMLLLGVQNARAGAVTLTWDEPGTVALYKNFAPTNANTVKLNVPADATEFVITEEDGISYLYVAGEGDNEVLNVVFPNNTYNASSYLGGAVSLPTNASYIKNQTGHVNLKPKLVMNSQFTINVLNGMVSGNMMVQATMWGSDRTIPLSLGLNTIAYDSNNESGVNITGRNGSSFSNDPWIKQNGVQKTWSVPLYKSDNMHEYSAGKYGFSFADGTDFIVNYDSTNLSGEGGGGEDPQTPEPTTYTVNFNLTENGNAALNMIFNVTQFQSYPANETTSIVVNAGDQIRLGFNTQVYNVTINGSALESNGNSTLKVYTINENTTFTIDATPQTSTISLKWSGEARNAISSIKTNVKNGSGTNITNPKLRSSFTCDKDKNYELTFDTQGYDVTINDVALTSSTYTASGLNAATLNISAAVHIPTVNLSFTFPGSGRAALTQIYDVTAEEPVAIGTGVVEVVQGHQIRLDFDVEHYDVVFNNAAQTAASYSFVANTDQTFTVNATIKPIVHDPIVTLGFLSTEARLALTGIMNNTTETEITSRSNFSVAEGTSITLTFNTTDYDVTVAGELLTAANNSKTLTINEDTMINIDAAEHEEGVNKVMVNITYAFDGEYALTGLYNATKNKDLPLLESFAFNEGNYLRLNFNTADFTIQLKVNGQNESLGTNSYIDIAIVGETTINISAQRKAIVAPTSGILVHWNIADAAVIHVGGIGDNSLINLPAGSTRYQIAQLPQGGYGAFYVEPLAGYVIKSVTIAGEPISPMYNSTRYRIDRTEYDACVVEVDLEAIVYDDTFTINLINGREAVKAQMWGTNRDIELHTGLNTYAYSTKFEPGVNFTANAREGHNTTYTYTVDGVERTVSIYPTTIYDKDGHVVTPEITTNDPLYDFYILQNDEVTAWVPVYGTLKNKCTTEGQYENKQGYWFEDGKNFVIKYWNDNDPEEVILPSTYINFNFADANAASSITMLYNITKKRSLTKSSMVEVMQQDQLRIMFDTFNWDVYIDGTKLTPADGTSTAYLFTAPNQESVTINIRVEERQYGTTQIGMYISDLNGVVLHNGTFDGPAIDTTGMTGGATQGFSYDAYKDGPRRSATLTYYTFEVSQKYPQIFVDEAEGYWLDAAQYTDSDNNTVDGTLATPNYTLYVVAKKITPTTPMVVYLATNGTTTTPETVMLRDIRHNEYELQNGYNEFIVDVEYVAQLTTMPLVDGTGVNFAVYQDMASIAVNADNETTYEMRVDGPTTVHIFCGTYPTQLNLNAYIEEGIDAKVKVDRNRTFTATTPNIPVFQGAEIEITHADGSMMFLDNEQKTCAGDHSHIFTATDDHKISIENAAVTLADAAGHTATVNKEVASVAYERELTPAATATWQAICLPFDVAYSTWSNAGYRVLALDKDQTLDGKIVFVEIGNKPMQHNTPYLVQTPAGADALTLAAENTTLYAKASTEELSVDDGGLVSFVGTLTPVSLSNSDTQMVYGLKGGEFLHAGEGAKTMKAFRAYLSLPVASTQQTRMKIQAKGGEQTGIDDVTIENAEEGVFYNLKGQRVDNPESGIYIFNGQKVIIR